MESCCLLSWSAILIASLVIYKLLDYLMRLPTIGQYSERYILVTGCDSGFGQAIARRLDGLGCHVFAGCLTETGQQELVKTCSGRLQPLDMNVTQHDSVLRALDFVKSKLPQGKGLWAVLNNAGITGNGGPEEWLTIDDYKEAIAVNLFGLIDVTMTFLPLVKKSRGRVVNMCSIAGRVAVYRGSPYSVSKYGVEAFTDNLRRSLKIYGCKVILIEPGFFRTNLTTRANIETSMIKVYNRLPAETKEEFGEEYAKKCVEATMDCIEKVGTIKMDSVLDVYEQALLGRFPRARYVVGLDARLIWLPASYMPEWFGDFVFGLADRSIPLPAALKKKKVD